MKEPKQLYAALRRKIIRARLKNKIQIGKNANVMKPFNFINGTNNNIKIGQYATIWNNSHIEIVYNYDEASLTIGEHFWANYNLVIFCFNKITIGDWVMIGPNVYIGDGNHGFSLTNKPFRLQKCSGGAYL